MKPNINFISGLLVLGILIACTQRPDQTPKQIAEEALHSATVRLEAKDADGEHLGYGSGFFVTRDQIVTDMHAVAGAASIEAKLVAEGKKFAIEGVTAFDTENKLAVLKVESKGTRPLPLGNSENVQDNTSIYVLGYSDGWTCKITPGKIHKWGKTLGLSELPPPEYSQGRIATKIMKESKDVVLAPANSGGPVLNSKGEVIGIVNPAYNILFDLGYAIPSNVIKSLLKKSRTVEPLPQWQERKPVRLIAIEQLAKKKGRHATVRLIRADDIEPIQLGDDLIILPSKGLGSGFFIAPDQIVTNIHCVANATKIQAKLLGTEDLYDIKGITGFDPKNDLVILKVENKTPKHLSLGNSDAVQIGEPIAAVGNPHPPVLIAETIETESVEEENIIKGIVHSIRKSDKLIRLTAKLSPGNSGGAILNSNGKVIGIAVGGTTSGAFSYAIPSNTLKRLLETSVDEENLTQWQDRKPIRAYAYWFQAQILITNSRRSDQKTKRHLCKKAIEMLNEAMELYPENRQSFYYSRGISKTEIDQYGEAISDFNEVIKLIPDGAFAYIARGNAKRDHRDYERAITDFSETIKLIPDYAGAYNNRGVVYYLWAKEQEKVEGKSEVVQSRYQAAIDDYEKSLELSPDHDKALNNLKLAKEALARETQ